jgi:hypothetical protein
LRVVCSTIDMSDLESNKTPPSHIPAEVWARARKSGADDVPEPTWYSGRLEIDADTRASEDGRRAIPAPVTHVDLAAIMEANRERPYRDAAANGGARMLHVVGMVLHVVAIVLLAPLRLLRALAERLVPGYAPR